MIVHLSLLTTMMNNIMYMYLLYRFLVKTMYTQYVLSRMQDNHKTVYTNILPKGGTSSLNGFATVWSVSTITSRYIDGRACYSTC